MVTPVHAALALVWVVGSAILVAGILARLVDGLDRRRLRRVAAQVELTDTIHRTLGAMVAPTVVAHHGRFRAVRMGLGPAERDVAGRLADLAWESVPRDGVPVQVVFVPRQG